MLLEQHYMTALSAEEEYIEKETQENNLLVIENLLSDIQFEVFQLRIEGYTMEQIGEELGVTRARIWQRIKQIQKILKVNDFSKVLEKIKFKNRFDQKTHEILQSNKLWDITLKPIGNCRDFKNLAKEYKNFPGLYGFFSTDLQKCYRIGRSLNVYSRIKGYFQSQLIDLWGIKKPFLIRLKKAPKDLKIQNTIERKYIQDYCPIFNYCNNPDQSYNARQFCARKLHS
jgi:predicted DNA-binding protein YlxM (UPF0122 family)